MNLSDLWIDPEWDTAQVWAAQHEYQMRQSRWQFYLGGGLAGAFRRFGETLRRLNLGVDSER